MATWTNNNPTYYINPAYLTFVEKSGYGANLIQVSASSSCYIFVYDPENGINYSDADKNYRKWKVTAYNNKFPNNQRHYIYVRLEKSGNSALVIYDTELRGVKGGLITVTTDEQGNEIYTEAEVDENTATYYYIRIGEAGETDGTSIRTISYDTGYLTSDKSQQDQSGISEMWFLDKVSTPWLIKAKQWLYSFTVKGFIKLIGGFAFSKGEEGDEKKITDVKRSIDTATEYLLNEDGTPKLDAEGNPVKNPDYVPVSDETIPSTKYVEQTMGGMGDKFLRKDRPDSTEHRITFKDGIETGDYINGMVGGSGAQIDRDGRGEMHSLTLREFLEVPELRFNRVDVVSGELWNSIAFGLVESVDTTSRTCTLKLEKGERSGLHVMDICRGIFSDFGQGNATQEGVDDNGFERLYGFSTSYFTPTEILTNEEGKFQFHYQLQEGTSVHPCASMKFAVYGNFIDPSRQASAYSTRTRKIYLNKVNTWKVDATRNYYAVYGLLDGITIGGQAMKGYGSYQHNAYLSGANIQFTPQQKEELKGQDSYSVVLTSPVGVIVIDDEGHIIGGEQQLMNVVTTIEGGEDAEVMNVLSGGENVVTGIYKLQTTVQAMCGTTPLYYSLAPEKGAYVLQVTPVGCKAAVLNGIVVVTEITEPENCHVAIGVNCEGQAYYELSYNITAVRDGKNPLTADLDNEMDAVACDAEGTVLYGLPVKTTASMWAGSTQLKLSHVEVTAPEGVTFTQTLVDQNGKPLGELTKEEMDAVTHTSCVVSVDAITKEAARTLPIDIRVEAAYGPNIYHRNLVFTVNKVIAGENAVIYKLLPSVKVVSLDNTNKLSIDHVSCRVNGFDGKKMSTVTQLPAGLKMEYAVDGGSFGSYVYDSDIAITKDNRKVEFRLYQLQGEEWELQDHETVWIVRDGNAVDGVREYYLASSYKEGVTREDGPWGDWQADVIPDISEEKPYLWNYEETTYSGSEPSYTEPVIITRWMGKGGIKEIVEWYMVNNDKDTVPGYDDKRWVSKVAPQMDKENRYLWNYEQIKWTDGEDDRTEPAIIGVFGEDGVSSLELVPSTSTISQNSFGTYEPANVRVRAVRAGKSEAVWMAAWGTYRNASGDDVQTSVYISSEKVEQWDFTPAAWDSKQFVRLEVFAFEERTTDHSPDTAFARTTINYIGDGHGGPMPRNCGQYSDTETYYYNDTYRDFVWYNNGGSTKVYLREGYGKSAAFDKNDAFGGIKGVAPTNTTYWIEVPKTVMTAIDTALIDTANIAGFMFKDGKMVSQETGSDPLNDISKSNLILDGTNGEIIAQKGAFKGDLYGKTISFDSLKEDSNGSYQLPVINGRYGMFYMDTVVGISRSAYSKTFVVGSKSDRIVRITGSSSVSDSSSISIYNQDTILLFSTYSSELGCDAWAATVIPYWVFGDEPEDSMVDDGLSPTSKRPVQNKVVYNKFEEIEDKLGNKIVKVSSWPPSSIDSETLYIL